MWRRCNRSSCANLPISAKLLLRIKLLKEVYLRIKKKKRFWIHVYTWFFSHLYITWSSSFRHLCVNSLHMCALYTYSIVLSIMLYHLFRIYLTYIAMWISSEIYQFDQMAFSNTRERVILPFDYRVTSRRYSMCMCIAMFLEKTLSLRALIACVVHR